MSLPFIGPDDVAGRISWSAIVRALDAGHRLPRARQGDTLLERGAEALLSRAAWIDGLGFGVKTATVMPSNTEAGLPTVHSSMLLFSDAYGTPEALLDGAMVTDWKTVADSLLGAKLLARPESRHLVVVGAGNVAGNLARGYAEIFPALERISIVNRTAERAEVLTAALARAGMPVRHVADLEAALAEADIVACATMSRTPVLFGRMVRPGTHVDLVGGFTPEMREADDDLIRKASVFVDCRETTLEAVGDIAEPWASGVLPPDRRIPDLYDLVAGSGGRSDAAEITLFKNGGGAHLDLMTARAILALAGGMG